MLRRAGYWGLVAALPGVGCLLPEVTVDDELAVAMEVTQGVEPSPPAGGGEADERESLCSTYCSRFIRLCTGHPAATYSDQRDCELTCLDERAWPLGDANETPDSVRCREYHSLLAELMGPATHCYHAAEVPSMGFCERVGAASP